MQCLGYSSVSIRDIRHVPFHRTSHFWVSPLLLVWSAWFSSISALNKEPFKTNSPPPLLQTLIPDDGPVPLKDKNQVFLFWERFHLSQKPCICPAVGPPASQVLAVTWSSPRPQDHKRSSIWSSLCKTDMPDSHKNWGESNMRENCYLALLQPQTLSPSFHKIPAQWHLSFPL